MAKIHSIVISNQTKNQTNQSNIITTFNGLTQNIQQKIDLLLTRTGTTRKMTMTDEVKMSSAPSHSHSGDNRNKRHKLMTSSLYETECYQMEINKTRVLVYVIWRYGVQFYAFHFVE